jgi:CheY-like chemotaxis protein
MATQHRILLVDDEAKNLLLLQRFLTLGGFQFDSAQNGAEAIQRVEQHPPHLILLDLKMPVMDGMEFLRWLKEYHPQIPVFILTANYLEETVQEATSLGAREYITKPLNLSQLQQKIEHVLHMPAQR